MSQTRSDDLTENQVNVHQLARESFYGFVGLTNAYIKVHPDQPLKINYDGRDCVVLEVNADGTARIEMATGEEIVPLEAAHMQPLFTQLAREFDLKIEGDWGVPGRAAAAAAGGTGG